MTFKPTEHVIQSYSTSHKLRTELHHSLVDYGFQITVSFYKDHRSVLLKSVCFGLCVVENLKSM